MADIADYRNAPSGIGPLANEWADKPHRLIYDLCNRLASLQEEVERLREALRPFVADWDAAIRMKADIANWPAEAGLNVNVTPTQLNAARSALSPVSEGEGWTPTHRHEKSGKSYRKIGQALHTESKELLVVYSTSAGVWYARPKDMFEDGRFVDVSEVEG